MPSPVYQQFNGNNTFWQLLKDFRTNPRGVLLKKYNIPDNLNDPNDIIQHLLNTGQISQDQINKAMQMGQNPMFRDLFK